MLACGIQQKQSMEGRSYFSFLPLEGNPRSDLLADLWLCLISVATPQGQCQAVLKIGEKEKSVFAWVLW